MKNIKNTENKYSRGKIYKITSLQTDEIYIGSTCQPYITNRFAGHTKDYRLYKNGGKAKYMSSFKMLEYEDADVELIELYPCTCKAELHTREKYWIKNSPNCCNHNIPTRTQKEYREDNKEIIAQKQKQYNESNKEDILKQKRIYYEANKEVIAEKGKQSYDKNKHVFMEKNKQYYEDNKEGVLQKRKEYRETHKEDIKTKAKIIIECECGRDYTYQHKLRHMRSKKHIQFMESQN